MQSFSDKTIPAYLCWMSANTKHWENVYLSKGPQEVSWTQEVPETSLQFIKSFNLPKDARIIDIGGGDSKLVDYLLEEGYFNITVLDISTTALDKAKQRLGEKAKSITWVVSDITEFIPATTYDLWHDRAAFHFLTTQEQIDKYVHIARQCVKGYLTVGTFSDKGPKKCSGLDITQYNENGLQTVFANAFTKLECINTVHTTPFNTTQHFIFCTFKANNK